MDLALGLDPTVFARIAAGLSAVLFLVILVRWEFSSADRSFLFLILCNLGWDLGYILAWPFPDPAAGPYRVMFAAACLLPGAFLDFLSHSTGSASRRWIHAAYLAGAILIAVSFWSGITKPWKIALGGFVALSTLAAIAMSWAASRSENSSLRIRARYLLAAVVAASVGGLIDLAQGISGRLPATGVLGGAVALAILGVATARLEVVAIHPLTLDLAVYGGLALVYAAVLIGLLQSIDPIWAFSLSAGLAIATVRPAADALRLFLKRILLGIRYQEMEVIRQIRETVLSSRSESALALGVCDLINRTFGLSKSIFTSERSTLTDPEIDALSRGPLTAATADRIRAGHLRESFKSGEWGAALGFFRAGEFSGALIVSPKKNGRRFFPDDLKLLELAGEELTFASENLRLARRERLAQLGEAIAMVAHEIKNPLTTLIGSAEILRSNLPTPDRREIGDRLASELHRLKNLVNEYLEYVRPCEPDRTSFDLVALVRETARSIDQVRIDAPAPVRVSADESKIRQVILNLIRNALESSGDAPVTISVGRELGDAVLRVKDSGPGIDPAVRGREFEPFVSRKAGGTGLGLAICKRIVESHGGGISISSHPAGAVAELRLGAIPS